MSGSRQPLRRRSSKVRLLDRLQMQSGKHGKKKHGAIDCTATSRFQSRRGAEFPLQCHFQDRCAMQSLELHQNQPLLERTVLGLF